MLRATAKTYRNAYAGLSKETWLLSLIMLINRSGTMVVPFMTLYLTSPEMGYSVGDAGIVFGLFGAGAFAGAWLGGQCRGPAAGAVYLRLYRGGRDPAGAQSDAEHA